MKNIQLEKQYLHKKHIHDTPTIKSVKSYPIHYKLFSLLASPKGYDAIASICANAHKNFSMKREYV